jgi:cell division protein FtsQ
MHQLADKKNKILVYLIFYVALCTISNKSIEINKNFSTKIETIKVFGLSKAYNLEIEKKLDILLFRNIFFIKKANINEVISEYSLVEKYNVKKIYPKYIKVDIQPTKFVAQIKGKQSFLIGSNGKLVNNKNTNERLPFLFGEFDSKIFLEFKSIVDESDFEFNDFKSIYFFPSRRWDIKTKNNIIIKLPHENLTEVLKTAQLIIKNFEFNSDKVIDLRIPNNVIIKNE